ncbi:MAG: BatD family protein, partial [Candidatus Cloacimonetes bacterium]|nr:BatD family protein [Candidatus Cloacimonadota bacterium]
MNSKNLTLFLLFVFTLLPVLLGAISVKASVNKNTLSTADRLEYTIEVSNEGSFTMSEPSPPQIGNFSFVNMRSSSSSSSTIVNFKRSTRVSRTFIYYYIPKAEGKTTIPAQQVRVVNKVYSTPAFEINVVKPVGSNPSQQGPAVDPFDVYTDPDLPWSASRMQGKTLLLAQMQHRKVFKGQPVVVSYYLYTDQMVRSFNLEEEQDFPGYGKSVYEQPTMLDYERVDYQGKRFQRALIKRLVLLPNETGRVQIPRMRGSARIYEFGYMSQNITSNNEYLEVLPLPDTNVPEAYAGAVGSFQVSESISTTKISLGEAVT